MVDTGLAIAIVRRLNRWYRKRAKPHGRVDHYYRGTRMTPTASKRVVYACMWLFFAAVTVGFLFIPKNELSDLPGLRLLLVKAGWVLMAGVALLMPLLAVRDFIVVTDDGVIKPKLFGGEKRFGWSDVVSIQMDPDGEDVIFVDGDRGKYKVSLAYDGWQDLLEMASRHLSPMLYVRLAGLYDSDRARAVPAGKSMG